MAALLRVHLTAAALAATVAAVFAVFAGFARLSAAAAAVSGSFHSVAAHCALGSCPAHVAAVAVATAKTAWRSVPDRDVAEIRQILGTEPTSGAA